VVLDAGKEYLIEARLRPLAETAGLKSVQHFIQKLRNSSPGADHWNVVEAMTTNETSFFRDHHPFETLRKVVLPALVGARGAGRMLNIWSAACSTGQEPYTVAMTLREHFPELESWNVRIRASDIATKILARARAGRFSQIEVNRGMPAAMMIKYFKRDGQVWEIAPEIRRAIEFFECNLMRAWPVMPRIDVIMVRNVLIYFDIESKRRILQAAYDHLSPDGYVLLGNSETTFGIFDGFERIDDRSGWHRIKPKGGSKP
jgi:chemotaxis protein methyltransferase CheR